MGPSGYGAPSSHAAGRRGANLCLSLAAIVSPLSPRGSKKGHVHLNNLTHRPPRPGAATLHGDDSSSPTADPVAVPSADPHDTSSPKSARPVSASRGRTAAPGERAPPPPRPLSHPTPASATDAAASQSGQGGRARPRAWRAGPPALSTRGAPSLATETGPGGQGTAAAPVPPDRPSAAAAARICPKLCGATAWARWPGLTAKVAAVRAAPTAARSSGVVVVAAVPPRPFFFS